MEHETIDIGSGSSTNKQIPSPTDKPVFQISVLALVFLLGILSAWLARFFVSGSAVNLTPEGFVSLIFTVAVGAASVILAVLAISFGRVSERIITERADKSIDIQMRLFEKSLSLQTQLFDKTMSTLEAIGRSTGVTEQRLGDLHNILQSPELRRQVAGKAVEELRAGGKAGEQLDVQPQMAEQLTKNIVRELARSLERPEQAIARHGLLRRQSTRHELPFEEELREEEQKAIRNQEGHKLEKDLQEAIDRISGAKVLPIGVRAIGYWDILFNYKGKLIAVDVRAQLTLNRAIQESMDQSIKLLISKPADGLIFAYPHSPDPNSLQHIADRNLAVHGRIGIVIADKEDIQKQVTRIAEEILNKASR